ncbi:Imm32 family immunity protein [Marinactinospora rubrisoli]|uniref:Uncharacterized protein n=1 Tax=Marinactinospora rubrisoli TaxID=2715399 RepID=A0ABW2KI15_9ACTN
MRCFPPSREVIVTGSADALHALAHTVAAGGRCTAGPGSEDGAVLLVAVEAGTAPGPVRVEADLAERVLRIHGAGEYRAVLGAALHDTAAMTDGGHLHVDHYPDHPYLAEGSAPLIVESPHGGMPRRP